jgi:cytochrome c-type biogenesis protein CcmH/NrfG
MKRDAVVFAVSGAFFGLLVGWILGTSQHPPGMPGGLTAPVAQTPAAATSTPGTAAPLDDAKVRSLEAQASANPGDATARIELGNAYFDAERYTDAIKWYQEAIQIDPKNVNASTDLGVAYYYVNQPDRAIQQFDHSLSIDPNHVKTILNLGIVRAFGKQDLAGAAQAWEKVIQLAPDSPEGRAAKQALDGLKSAHPGVGGAPGE